MGVGATLNDPKVQAAVGVIATIPVYGTAIAGAYEAIDGVVTLISNLGDVVDWLKGAVGTIGDALGIGPQQIDADIIDAMHADGIMGTRDDVFDATKNGTMFSRFIPRAIAAKLARNVVPEQWANAVRTSPPELQPAIFNALGMSDYGEFYPSIAELLHVTTNVPMPGANPDHPPWQQAIEAAQYANAQKVVADTIAKAKAAAAAQRDALHALGTSFLVGVTLAGGAKAPTPKAPPPPSAGELTVMALKKAAAAAGVDARTYLAQQPAPPPIIPVAHPPASSPSGGSSGGLVVAGIALAVLGAVALSR